MRILFDLFSFILRIMNEINLLFNTFNIAQLQLMHQFFIHD